MQSLAEYLAAKRSTWHEVASKSGIPLERIQSIGAGSEYSLGELRKLAKVLRVPISALSSESGIERLKLIFRQTSAKQDRIPTSSIDALCSRVEKILQVARGMPSNCSWLSYFSDLPPLPENAELFAFRFRERFLQGDQLIPVLTLPRVVTEDMGIFLLFTDDMDAEGASLLLEQYAFIFLAPRRFQPRMLFTLAHEAGHLLARHHDPNQGFATVDREGEIGSWGSPRSSSERFADGFASALLLPREAVVLLLRSVRETYSLTGSLGDIEINYLARFFGVSFEVAGKRCEALGLLPQFGARVLYDHLVKSHLNPERRADEVGLPPRENVEFPLPAKLLSAARQKVKDGSMSIGRAAEALRLPIEKLVASNVESGV